MIERTEKILLWVIRLCIVGILFLPLIVVPQALFLYIFGKAVLFQIFVEIAFGSWLILCLLNTVYRPQFRNTLILSMMFFLSILVMTAFTGIDPLRSFWSTQERMTGIILYLHLFAYALLLSSTIKQVFEWKMFLTASVAVNIIVLLFGFLELGIEGGRLASTLGNPVFFATYALSHFWTAGYLFFQERGRVLKWVYGCSVVLNAIAIVVAGSRGVFLAFFIGLLFFLFTFAFCIAKWSRRRLLLFGMLLLLGSGIITLVLLRTPSGITAGKKYLPNVISRTLYGGGESNRDRLALWTIAFQGWKERPILGWGWENYRTVYEKYLIPRSFMDTWYDRSHNQLLDVLVFTGSIGVFSYILFWFFISAFLIRAFRFPKEPKIRAAILCISAFFLSYGIQNVFAFDSLVPLIFFFMNVGLLISLTPRREHMPCKQKNRLLWWFVVTFAEVALAGMVWHLNVTPLYRSVEGVRGVVQIMFKQNIPEALIHLEKSFAGTSMTHAETGLQIAEIIGPHILNPTWSPTTEQRKDILVFLVEQFTKEIAGPPRPNYIQHYIGLSRLYYFLFRLTGDPDLLVRAESILNTAQKISPRRHQIFAQFADIAVARQQYDKALQYQRQAIALSPEDSKRFLYWGLAYMYGAKKNILKSLEALHTAESFGYPIYTDDSLIIPLVLAIKSEDDPYGDRVLDYIEHVVRVQPKNLKVLGAKIVILKKMRKGKEAKKIFYEIEKKEKSAGVYLQSLFKSIREEILP